MIMKARNAAKPARTCHHSKNGSGLMMFAPSAGGTPHREQVAPVWRHPETDALSVDSRDTAAWPRAVLARQAPAPPGADRYRSSG